MPIYAGAERVKQIFLAADTDRNGVLSKEEVTAIIKKLADWDDETIESLMKQCDYNKDGMLQIREFVDFLFSGSKKEREENRDGMINTVSIMAMHEAYYEDLKDRVHNYLRDHKISRQDYNWEDTWADAVPFCESNHVDLLTITSDAIRVAVGDRADLWCDRDMWFDKQEIPEEKLFEILPIVKDIMEKSLNPFIAVQILWFPASSPENGVDRTIRHLGTWKQEMKDILNRKEKELAADERFKERVTQMEALIEAAEQREKLEKEKDLENFKPLFAQVVAKAGWDEEKAQKVLDHMFRGNLYTETWYIHEFTEGRVAKNLEKIGVEPFDEDEMQVLMDFAFEHDELSKTVRYLAGKTGWDLRDQQQVVHKLRRIGCVHPRALQVNIKTGILNKQLKKHKFLPFGEKSMEILEGWASLYAASHSLG